MVQAVSNQKVDHFDVSSWSIDACKLNSSYSRIARQAGLSSTLPASHRISQETMRRWEKSAREATVICNQAASFNRCLFKIQQGMQAQLKTLRSESKGKRSTKVSAATDELQYLMDFNASITQAAAKTMEDFVFISMGNLTLARSDAYLNHVKTGIKPDTLSPLRTAPLHIPTLFPDSVIKRAEKEIAHYENKGQASSSRGKGRYRPYERQHKRLDNRSNRSEKPAWKNICKGQYRKKKGLFHPDQPRASSPINDNYRQVCWPGAKQLTPAETMNIKDTCKLCCKSCTYCTWAFAKKDISPCGCSADPPVAHGFLRRLVHK